MNEPEHLIGKKIVIYTVITNNYDNFLEHEKQDIECDYICFTEKNNYIDKIKEKISPVNQEIVNVILFRSNLFLIDELKKYNICIYIDGNAKIIKKDFIRNLLTEENFNNYDLIISKHPCRNCLYEEAKVSNGNKYKNTDLSRQVEDYSKDNYPKNNGLYWNGFMVYLHPFEERMIPFYDMYTDHLIKYVKNENLYYHPQGQVSLPYVLWKTNLKIKIIENEYLRNNGNIKICNHAKNI